MVDFLRLLSWKRKNAGAQLVAAPNGATQASLVSPLLREVLGERAGSIAATPPARNKDASAPALSQRLSVGAQLAGTRARTLEAASKLITLSDPETARAISVLAEDLEKRVCCIAFAGQVKAGKSTLINVLVENPDLLPADINPWTTVITRLHFGAPGGAKAGASFTFFTRDEWRRLSIGGRTRELTGRIFPGFDWTALNAQVEAMQQRASLKLGTRFEDLLGTVHTHPELTPGLLNRYVGAGHPGTEFPQEGAEGEFSDITKLADVFLDLGTFDFPTVLIDTPGVNDPFLMRDEITRQNLETADICVIVVTARQPLSSMDLSLLRMLRGLNKDRVIVFINKIDEIDGGEDVLHEISRRVTAILGQEFPSAHIPVVFGSAIWARNAVAHDVPAQDGPAALLNEAGFGWLSNPANSGAATAEAIFWKSGLSSLAAILSDMMRGTPVAATIEATESLLQAVCRNLLGWLETEIEIFEIIAADPGAAQNELSRLKALQAALTDEFAAFSRSLATIREKKGSELHAELAKAAKSSIAGSVAMASENASAIQAGQIDAKVRIELEGVVLTAAEEAGRSIAEEQKLLETALTRLFQESGVKHKPASIFGRAPAISPSLAALSEPAALDLAASLEGLAADRSAAAPGDANLQDAILGGFEPVVNELAVEAARVLNESTAELLHRMTALISGPIGTAIQRLSKGIDDAGAAAAGGLAASRSLEQTVLAVRDKIEKLKGVQALWEPAVPIGMES